MIVIAADCFTTKLTSQCFFPIKLKSLEYAYTALCLLGGVSIDIDNVVAKDTALASKKAQTACQLWSVNCSTPPKVKVTFSTDLLPIVILSFL